MPERTTKQQLADALIDGGLDRFVAVRRPARSWPVIARDLYLETDGLVDVHEATLRAWYRDIDLCEAAVP